MTNRFPLEDRASAAASGSGGGGSPAAMPTITPRVAVAAAAAVDAAAASGAFDAGGVPGRRQFPLLLRRDLRDAPPLNAAPHHRQTPCASSAANGRQTENKVVWCGKQHKTP